MTSEARKGKTEKKGFLYNMTHYKEYYIMLIPGILFFLVFCYGPMYGLVIAFQNYYPLKGISGSPFVGLKHFRALFTDPFFLSVLKNTLVISLYKLLICFPAPIVLCLISVSYTHLDVYKRQFQLCAHGV